MSVMRLSGIVALCFSFSLHEPKIRASIFGFQ